MRAAPRRIFERHEDRAHVLVGTTDIEARAHTQRRPFSGIVGIVHKRAAVVRRGAVGVGTEVKKRNAAHRLRPPDGTVPDVGPSRLPDLVGGRQADGVAVSVPCSVRVLPDGQAFLPVRRDRPRHRVRRGGIVLAIRPRHVAGLRIGDPEIDASLFQAKPARAWLFKREAARPDLTDVSAARKFVDDEFMVRLRRVDAQRRRGPDAVDAVGRVRVRRAESPHGVDFMLPARVRVLLVLDVEVVSPPRSEVELALRRRVRNCSQRPIPARPVDPGMEQGIGLLPILEMENVVLVCRHVAVQPPCGVFGPRPIRPRRAPAAVVLLRESVQVAVRTQIAGIQSVPQTEHRRERQPCTRLYDDVGL